MQARSSSNYVADGDDTPSTSKIVRLTPVPLETFDDYVIVGRLGAGGMAEVILGLSLGPNGFRKLVAIKRLHEQLCDDPDAVQMFMHEARLTAGLHHGNVVQVHKVGVSDGRAFMAMEYLDGQPINRVFMRLKARGLPGLPKIVVQLVLQALSGLHYVHEAKDYEGTPLSIVHRDISPQNLFVTFDGQVKLLDFGIAKARSIHAVTRAGLIKGKLGYIAPEQAAGQLVDRRADVWSIGVTLWEGLAGARLFKGRADLAAAHAFHDEELPPLNEVNPEISLELAAIVHKALTRDRDQRYRSALEFSQALECWLNAQPQGPQTPLSSTLRSLFFDTIGQREIAVRRCLSAIQDYGVLATLTESSSVAPVPEPFPNVAAVRSSLVFPRAMPRRWTQKAAIGAAVLIAMVLGILQAERGRSARAAPTSVEFSARSARTVGEPLAPSADLTPEALGRATAVLTGNAIRSGPALTDTATASVGTSLATRPVASSLSARKIKPWPHTPAPLAPEPRPPERSALPSDASVRSSASVPVVPPALGRLMLDSSPYAVVSLHGRRIGITPVEIDLPADKVVLDLRNPEYGIVTQYQVQIVAGETISRRVSLE